MKLVLKKILSFAISVFIFATFFFSYSDTVFANGVMMGRVDLKMVEASDYYLETGDSSKLIAAFQQNLNLVKAIVLSCNAFVTEDAINYITASEAVINAIPGNLTADEENGVVVGADLVAQIKQALQEYADETNPFKIEKTYRLDAIPASTFQSKEAYNSFKTYCSSHEIVLTNPQGYRFSIGDITPYIKEGGGFVKYSANVVVYNGNWKLQSIPVNMYTEKRNSDGSYTIEVQENYGSTQWIGHYNPSKTDFKQYGQQAFIVTRDGGRIRVFNSAAEFMDYNAGQRKVYFGKGFYDFDPAEITATWDEISDAIDRMDGILQDILDAITANPGMSEEDLEKLIDSLLGKLGEIGDKTDETNTILGNIADSLSGYFNSVLSKLDEILSAVKALVWIEIDDKLEEDKTDLFDLMDKIWENPEEGSKEAADTLAMSFSEVAAGLTKKFPFSIPWDIHALFTVFTGTPPPSQAKYRTMTLGAKPFTVDPEDLEQDVHDAPYFVLPLKVDSYGIEEQLVIDLKDFSSVSTLSRTLLSVLFAVFLIKFTIRIIELFKGGAD